MTLNTEPGSKGMTLEADGRLTVAGHAGRTVWRLEYLDPKAQVTVLVGSYQGKKLNSPNDDPPYGLPQSDSDPKKELQGNGIYRIPNARRQKPGAPPARDKLQLVIKDLERPNGIAFSPDEKFVYIAECHESVLRRAENSFCTNRPNAAA